VAAAAVVAVAIVRRRRRADERGDVAPAEPSGQGSLVDAASEDSFPASDPPSYWGREAD
jgi:hypothetical protein